jgi:hypothetical protein
MLVFNAVALLGRWFIKAYDMNGAMGTERGFVDKDKVADVEKEQPVI